MSCESKINVPVCHFVIDKHVNSWNKLFIVVIPVNTPPLRGSLPHKSLISRMDWVSCAGDLNLPHTPFPPARFPPNKNIFFRFWGSPPSLLSTFKIFRPWKKSSTIKSWPTFCDQYFWIFPIWNSRAEEKCREIRMVKVNVIFNDIRLLICLTPLQVNWVMMIN
jgi:hypothetical protein